MLRAGAPGDLWRDPGHVDVPRGGAELEFALDLTLDDSQLGQDKSIAGTTVPTFVQRKVTTRLRLRDGESNLLAGLLQDSEQNGVQGFPGAIHVPGLKQLFSGNNITTDQIDIVMLLTPHIVRTHEITEEDLKPIFIGSQQNLGVGGPPPLIAPPEAAPAAPPAPAPGAPAGVPAVLPGPGGTTVGPPPGSSPVPGTVPLQPAPAQPTTGVPPQPQPPVVTPTPPEPTAPAAPPVTQPPPAAQNPPAVPTTSPGVGSAQVLITSPGPTLRVGGGPYTMPISITDATRLSTITLRAASCAPAASTSSSRNR